MCSPSWLRSASLVLLFLCITIAGCSSNYKNRAKVKGRVKFFDKYLTCGTVSFTAKDGRVGSASIDFEGNYEMGDAPVGDVTITVKVPKVASGPAGGGLPTAKPPPGLPEMRPPGDSGDKTFTPMIDPAKIVEIPGRYGSADTSGLNYIVEKGSQTKDITLSP